MERETEEKLWRGGERFNILSKPGSGKGEKNKLRQTRVTEGRDFERGRGLRENTVDELK